MKKFLVSIAIVSLASSLLAQQHLSQSFLSGILKSIALTNTASKGGLTNLLQWELFANTTAGATNSAVVMWTNVSNGFYTNDAARVGTYGTYNFLSDVNLWALRNGEPACATVPTNTWGGTDWSGQALGFANICIKMQVPATMDQVVNFRFVPVPDGVNAADDKAWIATFATAASTQVTVFTNAPLHKWVGCKKLRLSEIWTGDHANSRTVWIQSITLNGFVP